MEFIKIEDYNKLTPYEKNSYELSLYKSGIFLMNAMMMLFVVVGIFAIICNIKIVNSNLINKIIVCLIILIIVFGIIVITQFQKKWLYQLIYSIIIRSLIKGTIYLIALIGISLLHFYLILESLNVLLKTHPNPFTIVYFYLVPIFLLHITLFFLEKECKKITDIIDDSMKNTDLFLDVIFSPVTNLLFICHLKYEVRKEKKKFMKLYSK